VTGNTGSLNNLYLANDLEGNGTSGSTYGGMYLERTRSDVVESNYFEGEPRDVVLGILGAGSYYASNGTLVQGNHFTSASATYALAVLEDAAGNNNRIGPNTYDGAGWPGTNPITFSGSGDIVLDDGHGNITLAGGFVARYTSADIDLTVGGIPETASVPWGWSSNGTLDTLALGAVSPMYYDLGGGNVISVAFISPHSMQVGASGSYVTQPLNATLTGNRVTTWDGIPIIGLKL
jgi:hypothetical protein